MHLHDRMLGLVDRRFEHGRVALRLPGRGIGLRRAIVVDIAVECPQLIGEAAQRRGQCLVGGDVADGRWSIRSSGRVDRRRPPRSVLERLRDTLV